jgi:hypothetical protein
VESGFGLLGHTLHIPQFISLGIFIPVKKFIRLQIKMEAAILEIALATGTGSPKIIKINGNTRTKKTSKVS